MASLSLFIPLQSFHVWEGVWQVRVSFSVLFNLTFFNDQPFSKMPNSLRYHRTNSAY